MIFYEGIAPSCLIYDLQVEHNRVEVCTMMWAHNIQYITIPDVDDQNTHLM